jgi:hypothetical protein
MTNINDFFKEDKLGVLGSEPIPLDNTYKYEYLKRIQIRIHKILMDESQMKNVMDDMKQIKEWWLQGFEDNNVDPSPYVCNLNDIFSHTYQQLVYLQHHRHLRVHLEFERKQWTPEGNLRYQYQYIINACCALAELAGCRHIHLMSDPELQRETIMSIGKNTKIMKTTRELDLEKEEKKSKVASVNPLGPKVTPLDTIECRDFPTMDDLDSFVQKHHLGYINLWYYYRRSQKDKSHQWDVHDHAEEYIRGLKEEHVAKIHRKRKREREVAALGALSNPLESKEELKEPIVTKSVPDDLDAKDQEWFKPSDEWLLVRSVHTYYLTNQIPIADGCLLWKRDPLWYIDRLLMIQNHIFAQVYKEYQLLEMFPILPYDKPIKQESRDLMQKWLLDCLSKNIGSDSFTNQLRHIICDHILPLGSKTLSDRLNTHNKNSDILFKDMIGHAGVIYINQLFLQPNLHKHIAQTPSHPLYPYLLLCVLHFDFKQHDQVFLNWYQEYVIKNTEVIYASKGINRLQEITIESRSRLPYLIRLKKNWYIHTIYPRSYWIECKDVVEWLLVWFSIVIRMYPSGCLPNRKYILHWIHQFNI